MKNKGFSVLICICFLALLFLPGLLKNLQGQGEEGKTKVEEQSLESTTKEKFHEEKEGI